MLDFNSFRCLSFDCYGTLIDWETGILRAMRPILNSHDVEISDDEILRAYSTLEPAEQRRSYRSYKEILQGVVIGFADRYSFRASLEQVQSLAESLPKWQPFADTVPALRRLKKKYKLAVISNIDDDLFASTARLLENPFEFGITAQQAKSYKPSHRNFQIAIERIGLPKEQLLHVAESLFHDVAPCNQLGIRSVWVNRRGGKPASATKTSEAKADLEVPDLHRLCELAL